MKHYAFLFFLAFFLIGCEKAQPTVDKPTFILAMEKNMYAFEQMSLASEALLGEIYLIMMFTEDSSQYVEQVAAFQEELDRIVLEAKTIAVPKDASSQEMYQHYLDLLTERTMTYQHFLESMMTFNLVEMFGVTMSVSWNFDEEWAQFQSLWIAYKAG